MKIATNDLTELCLIDGGKFAVNSVFQAQNFCKKIAKGHYENFPVSSFLVPKKLQKHFFSIYAFARIADDISDELNLLFDAEQSLIALKNYENCLEKIYVGAYCICPDDNIKGVCNTPLQQISNPIFLALKDTVEQFHIPIEPFKKLLTAFRSDIIFKQPENIEELFAYCVNSANPVGELLLRIFNEYSEENLRHSDCICTALQLINFWQDFSVDLNRGRCYIPKSILGCEYNFASVHNFISNMLENEKSEKEISNMLEKLYEITEKEMNQGKKLLKNIKNFRFRLELFAIIFGGKLILKKIKKQKNNIFFTRPKLCN